MPLWHFLLPHADAGARLPPGLLLRQCIKDHALLKFCADAALSAARDAAAEAGDETAADAAAAAATAASGHPAYGLFLLLATGVIEASGESSSQRGRAAAAAGAAAAATFSEARARFACTGAANGAGAAAAGARFLDFAAAGRGGNGAAAGAGAGMQPPTCSCAVSCLCRESVRGRNSIGSSSRFSFGSSDPKLRCSFHRRRQAELRAAATITHPADACHSTFKEAQL
jgi:hypothetical protein